MTLLQQQLEALIDQHGVVEVLRTLGAVCYAKEEHITGAWQDLHLANAWCTVGNQMHRAADHAARIP